jgi:hypothetical protein
MRAASTLLFLGILSLGARAACAATPPGGADSARLLPPDTVLILHADLASLRDSVLYRRLTGQAPGLFNPLMHGPLEPGLFDLDKDLDAVTIGVGSDLRSVYVVLRGRFPSASFEAIARSSGAFAEERRDGLNVFRLKRNDSGPDALSTYAVLGEQILIVAADRSFGALLEAARGSGPNAADSPLLRDLLGRGPRGQISMDLRFTEPARRRLGAAGPLGPMPELDALESLQVGISFAEELELYARGGTGDEAASLRLFNAAAGWLAIGRMLLGAEALGTALNKFQIERNGAELNLSLRLSAEEAELLLRE